MIEQLNAVFIDKYNPLDHYIKNHSSWDKYCDSYYSDYHVLWHFQFPFKTTLISLILILMTKTGADGSGKLT